MHAPEKETNDDGSAPGLLLVAFVSGHDRHLFIDDRGVSSARGVKPTMNPPRKAGVVLRADTPWESYRIGPWSSVVAADDGYRLYYMTLEGAYRGFSAQGLATSDDGVRWDKPTVGRVAFAGDRRNNLLALPRQTTVMLDPNASGSRRLWALGVDMPGTNRGAVLYASSDGSDWREMVAPAMPFHCDSGNQVLWDDRLGRYVAYLRGWRRPGERSPADGSGPAVRDVLAWRRAMGGEPIRGRRTVVRAEHDALTEPWPHHQVAEPWRMWEAKHGEHHPCISGEYSVVLEADERDPVTAQIYNSAVVKYPLADDVYVAFPSFLDYWWHDEDTFNGGTMEIGLALSRDGIDWRRPYREPYVPLGLPGEGDSAQGYMAVGMIVEGDRIQQYYLGYDVNHGFPKRSFPPRSGPGEEPRYQGQMFRLEQRVDGFVSLDAGPDGGEIVTEPRAVTGAGLHLNLDSGSLGRAAVELLDEGGRPLPGFGLEACRLLNGNLPNALVRWHAGSDLTDLHGRRVRLRIVMVRCKLYAFWFEGGGG